MRRCAFPVLAVAGLPALALAQEKLNFTYLWHLEQPIYWPDQKTGSPDRYEFAWESILRTDGGASHPANNLRDIFSVSDRVAVYQYRAADAIDAIDWAPTAGAQVSYSGGLIQNIQSLGSAGQLGYSNAWNQTYRNARAWRTVGASKPRLDVVLFPFHHALMPLLDESAQRKEIEAYKQIYTATWGASAPMSRGFFPSEMAFSERLIKVLDEQGIDWSIVSAEKISRANVDFPVVFGSGGVNCDPPNQADRINSGTHNYFRQSISRGCGPAEAFPQSLTPQRAQYVDPDTGTVHEIIVVPASQSLGWQDGYAPIGLNGFDTLQTGNPSDRPMLVVLAHDGDNAWGGGYSYYMEATPNLVSQAQAAGYHATVIEEYLANHPVPAGAIVHVEDGAWVNADGDFGSPQFLNWNWPPVDASGNVDIANGWAEDIRNWAIITSTQNWVDTAEQVAFDAGAPVRMSQIVSPDSSALPAEWAWHYFLASLNSGYMYYGTSLDMEVKPTIACNEALQHAQPLALSGTDRTPPTIWIPQRWPWNPGAVNFGPAHGYQIENAPSDFWIWTFADDVSGVSTVSLKYRIDNDGVNPLGSTQNETYAGGNEVGAWQSMPMTGRDFPAGNVFNDPSIDFFEMPQDIARAYHAHVAGLSNVLIDYYVEATDTLGNLRRSPIQHVWIGDGSGSGGGDTVVVDPDPPVAGQSVTITYDPTARPLDSAPQVWIHYGYDNWNTVPADLAMTSSGGAWHITLNLPTSLAQLDMVFNNGSGTWDNNNGQDWHFAVEGAQPPAFVIDGSLDADAMLIAQNAGRSLWAGLDGDMLYVASSPAGGGNDHFIFVAETPGSLQPAPWAKSGQVAAWSAFLGNEADNGWSGWFGAAGTSARGAVLEGIIDLNAQLGMLPDSIYLALGAFQTPDGGSLVAQVPAGNSNSNLDPSEWVQVHLCDINVEGCDSCPPDVNNDGVLDFFDVQTFLGMFASRDPAADWNSDGLLDFFDVQAFLGVFSAGCS